MTATKVTDDELRALAEMATPGPWFAHDGDRDATSERDASSLSGGEAWTVSRTAEAHGWTNDNGVPGYGLSEANARFQGNTIHWYNWQFKGAS